MLVACVPSGLAVTHRVALEVRYCRACYESVSVIPKGTSDMTFLEEKVGF